MFLCPTCHAKSTCRSELHIDIAMKKCESCGHFSNCFGCKPDVVIARRRVFSDESIAQYRNTRLLKPYKKINF